MERILSIFDNIDDGSDESNQDFVWWRRIDIDLSRRNLFVLNSVTSTSKVELEVEKVVNARFTSDI